MSELQIRTNNKPREILYWYDLTAKEQAEHDYLDTPEEQDSASFMRYRGWVYYLPDFVRPAPDAPKSMRKWHGYSPDSYFSGVLIKYVDDFDRVVAATYFS
jgi:hypothetical protein